MPSPSKQKGNRYERELVNSAKRVGLEAKRSWGSDGRSLGLHEEVDLVVEDWTIQAKIRKRIAKWVKPSDFIDAQIVRENNGESFVIMRYEDWLLEQKDKKKMIKELRRLQK
tara:strand:- start:1351 stop:1686 length:336 start_codon:yes stop_codon:yes gene_type:complete